MKLKLIAPILLMILIACGEEREEQVLTHEPEWTQDNSSDMNAVFTAEEDEEIELFIQRHQ
jgi:hypothetical protein